MRNLKGHGTRGWLAATAAATVVLAGCGGSPNDALPLVRADVTVKSVSMGGACETVPVRIVPVELRGEANKYANDKTMVIEIEMAGPTDENGAPMCNGAGQTLPIAPGDWDFSAPLASGPARCTYEIRTDQNNEIIFIDGVEGCSGAPPEPVYEEMPVEGAEGEVAEGEETETPAA